MGNMEPRRLHETGRRWGRREEESSRCHPAFCPSKGDPIDLYGPQPSQDHLTNHHLPHHQMRDGVREEKSAVTCACQNTPAHSCGHSATWPLPSVAWQQAWLLSLIRKGQGGNTRVCVEGILAKQERQGGIQEEGVEDISWMCSAPVPALNHQNAIRGCPSPGGKGTQ